ncbi:HAD-IIB family hydrolase [Kiritimatiellaeota bacterium B1221]|nr:HAD-IIB family hydrolase [Kiritimatiellaeota bacterium B1221]
MSKLNNQTKIIRKVLATDLDGTLIPLPDSAENQSALEEISKAYEHNGLILIYCTGRHFESVMDAMTQEKLPRPEWIICDVGTSIYHMHNGRYLPFEEFKTHLTEKTHASSQQAIHSILEGLPGLSRQQADHQQEFKLSYECESSRTDLLVEQINELLRDFKIPYEAHGSIDPFLNCGLIDLLPEGVSKAYALKWLARHVGYGADQVIYAGDSGNDFLALTSGCRAILVANAGKDLTEKVKSALKEKKKSYALYVSKKQATSGVLDGCKHFKWM